LAKVGRKRLKAKVEVVCRPSTIVTETRTNLQLGKLISEIMDIKSPLARNIKFIPD
jgi:hypothetical protein